MASPRALGARRLVMHRSIDACVVTCRRGAEAFSAMSATGCHQLVLSLQDSVHPYSTQPLVAPSLLGDGGFLLVDGTRAAYWQTGEPIFCHLQNPGFWKSLFLEFAAKWQRETPTSTPASHPPPLIPHPSSIIHHPYHLNPSSLIIYGRRRDIPHTLLERLPPNTAPSGTACRTTPAINTYTHQLTKQARACAL